LLNRGPYDLVFFAGGSLALDLRRFSAATTIWRYKQLQTGVREKEKVETKGESDAKS
jgi:hypothetical protein